MTASYTPGAGVALVGRSCWALLGVDSANPVVEALWPAVQADRPLTELLDLLLHKGLSDLPSFALAHWDGGLRLVVRGEAVVQLGEDEDPLQLLASDLVSWFEYAAASEPSLIRMSLPGAALEAAAFPSVGGVMLADRLEVRGLAASTAEPVPAEAAATAEPVPAEPAAPPAPSLMQPATLHLKPLELDPEPVVVVEAAMPEPEVLAGQGGLPEHSDQTLSFQADMLSGAIDAAAEPEPWPEPIADPVVEAEPEPEGPSYDHLFGETMNRLPGIVVPDPAPATAPAPPPPPPPPSLPPPRAVPIAAFTVEPPAPAPVPPTNGLIDAVPWATSPPPGTPAPPSSTPPTSASLPPLSSFAPPSGEPVAEMDEHTIRRGDLEALVRAQAAFSDRVGPVVHAVSCPQGHLNDPQSGTCRICNRPLPDQEPVTLPRPVLGTLRLSTGDLVNLDRGVLLGRNPSTTIEGVDKPHLVKLGSPANEISRNHVSVELDGWHILVRDLRTTNGTVVQLPGEDPRRLRPEDPQPITPGSVVTLGDGVSFTFEVDS